MKFRTTWRRARNEQDVTLFCIRRNGRHRDNVLRHAEHWTGVEIAGGADIQPEGSVGAASASEDAEATRSALFRPIAEQRSRACATIEYVSPRLATNGSPCLIAKTKQATSALRTYGGDGLQEMETRRVIRYEAYVSSGEAERKENAPLQAAKTLAQLYPYMHQSRLLYGYIASGIIVRFRSLHQQGSRHAATSLCGAAALRARQGRTFPPHLMAVGACARLHASSVGLCGIQRWRPRARSKPACLAVAAEHFRLQYAAASPPYDNRQQQQQPRRRR